MASYKKGVETKRKFVELVHEKLKTQDASSITVRDISTEYGYSPAALYRHFENFDHLIVLASMGFLADYMKEYRVLIDTRDNLQKFYVDAWSLFNHYAFARPDIFYRLFWGQYNENFVKTYDEYMELFPTTVADDDFPDWFGEMFRVSNMQERDYMVLQEGVRSGLVSDDNAHFLSKVNPMIVMCMLMAQVDGGSGESNKEAEEECNALIMRNFENSLN